MSAEHTPSLPEQETARQVEQLVRTRLELKAAGSDLAAIDEQLRPFRTQYVKAGARYGGNFAGMLQWFQERAAAPQP